jgi:hypothetical protein
MRTDGLVCHRGPEQRSRKDCGGSNEFEIGHRVSPFGLENAMDQSWQRTDVPALVPKRNFIGGRSQRGASVPALTHRRYRPQARRFSPAGFSFAVVGRGELLLLQLLPFKAILLSECERGRKSGSPPLFAPSFKVQGDIAHNSKAPGSRSPPV